MPSLSIPSPVGQLTIDEADEAIVAIRWAGRAEPATAARCSPRRRRQLDAYFAGRLSRFRSAAAPAGSPFDERVWAAMRQIPYGETRSYGDLAHGDRLGAARGRRRLRQQPDPDRHPVPPRAGARRARRL